MAPAVEVLAQSQGVNTEAWKDEQVGAAAVASRVRILKFILERED